MFSKTIFHVSFVLGMLSGSVLPSMAEGTPDYMTLQVPVYGNVVVTQAPLDWPKTPAHQKHSGGSYIMEMLPKGQSLTSWKEMITIMGFKDFPGTPRQLFTGLYLQQQKICSVENVAAEVYSETPNLFVAVLMCGGPTAQASGVAGLKRGQGEMALFKIQKQDGNLYMIFKSWRGPAYKTKGFLPGDLPVSQEGAREYLKVLAQSQLVKKSSR